jgi:hypothetical protein
MAPELPDKIILLIAIGLVAIYSVAVLFTFIDGLKKFRERVRYIYRNEFHAAEQKGHGNPQGQRLVQQSRIHLRSHWRIFGRRNPCRLWGVACCLTTCVHSSSIAKNASAASAARCGEGVEAINAA